MKTYSVKVEEKKVPGIFIFKYCCVLTFCLAPIFIFLVYKNPNDSFLIKAVSLTFLIVVCGAIGGPVLVNFVLNWLERIINIFKKPAGGNG